MRFTTCGCIEQYMLDGKDLESSLKDAELRSKSFQDCQKKPPSINLATKTQTSYLIMIRNCAVKADPSLKSIFDVLKLD
jgi:hypothetical protein